MVQSARDVYHRHVLDLTGVELSRLPTFMAMSELEAEAIEAVTNPK